MKYVHCMKINSVCFDYQCLYFTLSFETYGLYFLSFYGNYFLEYLYWKYWQTIWINNFSQSEPILQRFYMNIFRVLGNKVLNWFTWLTGKVLKIRTWFLSGLDFLRLLLRIVVFSWILFGLLWVSGIISLLSEKMRSQVSRKVFL